MSGRRHFSDSSVNRLNSNLSRGVEEFLGVEPDNQVQDEAVTPLRSQLALEYRLQNLCQRLLESYKEQYDWAAVGQVAQSLVTNTQRIGLLKERLLSRDYSSVPRRLHSISEQPPGANESQAPTPSGSAGREAQETLLDTGTESGSESSSVREVFEGGKEEAAIIVASPPPECFESQSGASSAVEYETASQQTSEAEPESSAVDSESGTKVEESVGRLVSPSATSTAPSSHHLPTSEDSADFVDIVTANISSTDLPIQGPGKISKHPSDLICGPPEFSVGDCAGIEGEESSPQTEIRDPSPAGQEVGKKREESEELTSEEEAKMAAIMNTEAERERECIEAAEGKQGVGAGAEQVRENGVVEDTAATDTDTVALANGVCQAGKLKDDGAEEEGGEREEGGGENGGEEGGGEEGEVGGEEKGGEEGSGEEAGGECRCSVSGGEGDTHVANGDNSFPIITEGPPPPVVINAPPPVVMDGPPPVVMDGPPPVVMDGPPPVVMDGLPPVVMDGLPPVVIDGLPPVVMDGPPPVVMDGLPPVVMDGLPPVVIDGLPPVVMDGPPPVVMDGLPPVVMDGLPPVIIEDSTEAGSRSSSPPDSVSTEPTASLPGEELNSGSRTSLSPPLRHISQSGSDSFLNLRYSKQNRTEDLFNQCASSDELEAATHSMTVASTTGGNRKRQASIPSIVSKGTRGLRKSLKKRMSVKLRRTHATSDALPPTAVMTLSPIRGQDWDPTCLLEELYADYRRVARSSTWENARHYGYLEKLPVAQTKKNILKGYKRRYFRAVDGNLYYYEDRLSERALGFLKLENCRVSIVPEKIQLHITESSGKVLVVRAPNHVELSDWHRALQLESVHSTTVDSTLVSIGENPVIIVDIGASSVRVGLAGSDAYPELFFPAVCSVDSTTGECNDCGLAALLPENRFGAKLVYPRRNTVQMSRNSSANNQAIVDILDAVLNHYDLKPYQCSLLLTLPPTVPEQERSELAEALLSTVFQFQGILFQEQALLALYSYNTTAGIVVDIGDHIDIVPVIDGYPIEAAINRLPFGGNAITEYLTKLLTSQGIRYFSETETYINRFIKEDACVVSLNYAEDCDTCESKPAIYSHQINVDRFQLPDHRKAIVLNSTRFMATEGLFTPGVWGKDVTGLHDMIWKSVQACPIDHRKLLLRSIFLSGGTSLLPGLKERLKAELSALAPAGNTVEVHASENRQHAAFLGASVLAGLTSFRQSVITQDEWNSKGVNALDKWYSS